MKITDVSLQEQKEYAKDRLLNEFWFFDRKAKQFANQLDRVHVVPGNPGEPAVVRNADLFAGTLYLDHTHLPDQRWNLFKDSSPVPVRGNAVSDVIVKPFQLIFILGYQFEVNQGLFYEIWFDSKSGAYTVLDKFAAPVTSYLSTLDQAVDALVEIISQDNTKLKLKDLSYKERTYLDKLAQRNLDQASEAEEKDALNALLESTTVSRLAISDMLNSQVYEYSSTKLNQQDQKWFFQRWGKIDVSQPLDYMNRGLRGFFNKVVGHRREANFIIGFDLLNRIDVEIWYIRDMTTNIGGYYVFNLTSRELIAGDLNSIRQAYLAVGKHITLPTDILSKVK